MSSNGGLSYPMRSILGRVSPRPCFALTHVQFPQNESILMNTFFTVYRLNTYPLIHRGLLHALLNAVALVPLLERFESEHGTLLTGAMFAGRKFGLDRKLSTFTEMFCDSSFDSPCRRLSPYRTRYLPAERSPSRSQVNSIEIGWHRN